MPQSDTFHRRIVTGHDADGKSVVVADGPAPRRFNFAATPGMANELVWATDGHGRAISIGTEASGLSYVPEIGGTRLMIVRFPPDAVFLSPAFDPMAAEAEQLALLPGLAERFEPDAPGFHQTQTVDYGIVLDGEIALQLEDGPPVVLRRGDIVVQNATRHAWRNMMSAPAIMAFVLVGAPTASFDSTSEPIVRDTSTALSEPKRNSKP